MQGMDKKKLHVARVVIEYEFAFMAEEDEPGRSHDIPPRAHGVALSMLPRAMPRGQSILNYAVVSTSAARPGDRPPLGASEHDIVFSNGAPAALTWAAAMKGCV